MNCTLVMGMYPFLACMKLESSLLHSYHILLQSDSDVGDISVTSWEKVRLNLILKSIQASNQISILHFLKSVALLLRGPFFISVL